MGCIQSNSKIERGILKANEKYNYFNDLDTLPEKDSRLPLNVRQVFKLKQSWKGIKRKSSEAGVEMFIRLVQHILNLIELSTL